MKLPNLPYIDRIWRIKGSLPLEAGQPPAEVFETLDPLFSTDNTIYHVDGDTLTYHNKNPNPQNRLATFTRGTLRVGDGGSKLFYDATSPALLFCMLAPLLFLVFGQINVMLDEYEKPTPEEIAKKKEEAKKEEERHAAIPLHPIDKFLGAPTPEKPKEEKKDDKKDDNGGGKKGRGAMMAQIYAGIFAAMYLIGRILEPWLFRRTFRKQLNGTLSDEQTFSQEAEAGHRA